MSDHCSMSSSDLSEKASSSKSEDEMNKMQQNDNNRWHFLGQCAPEVARSTPPPPMTAARSDSSVVDKLGSSALVLVSLALICGIPIVAGEPFDGSVAMANNDHRLSQLVDQVLSEQLNRNTNSNLYATRGGQNAPESASFAERYRRLTGGSHRAAAALLLPVAAADGHGRLFNGTNAFRIDSLSSLLGDDALGDTPSGPMARHYLPKTISTARGFGKRSDAGSAEQVDIPVQRRDLLSAPSYYQQKYPAAQPVQWVSVPSEGNSDRRWQRKWMRSSDLSDLLEQSRYYSDA